MSTAVQVEIVIPESMGKIEALAKVSAVLDQVIARRLRWWNASRGEIAVFGPTTPESRTERWCIALPVTWAAIRCATSGT